MSIFRSRLAWALAGVAIVLVPGLEPASLAQGETFVDLELLLAVDASSSVSTEEFDLQMRGLSDAFRHPAVIGAIRAVGDFGIAVSLVQWSDNRRQFLAVDWMAVKDGASSHAFAEEIANTPRFLIGGGTAIGGALKFSMGQFGKNAFIGRRKVIDLSGDGRNNQGSQPSKMRDGAVAAGITVNGLAIMNEDQTVQRYYLANVIGGTGAFVMSVDDYDDFADAILEKLIKEIAGAPIAEGPRRSEAMLASATAARRAPNR